MKIAGQKNSGAWYRVNRWLKSIRGAGTSGNSYIANGILALSTIAAYVDALNDIAAKVGNVQGTPPAAFTAQSLVTAWLAHGIPLEVWMGRFMYDTYSKTTAAGGKVAYKPDHAIAALQFGNDLRAFLSHYKAYNRMALDIGDTTTKDQGNPGGLPDLDPAT